MMKNKSCLLVALLFSCVFFSCYNSTQKAVKAEEAKLPIELPVQRYGTITGLNPEKEVYYRQLHADAWPVVLAKIKACNIRNYSIYIKNIEGKPYLFSYFEYTGSDFKKDMEKMAADSTTRRWWKETDPCQLPLPDAVAENKIWSPMEEVFHQD